MKTSIEPPSGFGWGKSIWGFQTPHDAIITHLRRVSEKVIAVEENDRTYVGRVRPRRWLVSGLGKYLVRWCDGKLCTISITQKSCTSIGLIVGELQGPVPLTSSPRM